MQKYQDTTIYVNGVFKTSSATLNLTNFTGPFLIGGQDLSLTNQYNGTLDEVIVYNSTLTSTEIEEIYLDYTNPFIPYSGATENVNLSGYDITTTGTGFFGWLGSLTSRVVKLFVQDIDANGTINASSFIGDGHKITNTSGYVLQASHASYNPVDSTKVYWGGDFGSAPQTTAQSADIRIPKKAVIRSYYGNSYVSGTLGSAEAINFSLIINNVTEYTIASGILYNTRFVNYKNTFNISVNEGDYIQIKQSNPTWATNPTGVSGRATIYLE